MNRRKPPVLALLPDLVTLMQRIQDAAVHGYRYYVTGMIDPAKWDAFALKMDGRYEIAISSSTRSKRRKAGEAVCLLYGCQVPPHRPEAKCPWVLMASEGRGRVHGETLHELTKERLTLADYELVHDGKCWTWRMSAARERAWRDHIIRIARLAPERRRTGMDVDGPFDADIERLMDRLYREPGFRLIRRQIGGLVKTARAAWRRFRPDSGPPIRTRSFLPYVRRLPNRR